jgi:nicotinamidase-related amidase
VSDAARSAPISSAGRADPSPGDTALIIIECQAGVVGDISVLPALAKAAAPVLPVIGRLAHGARAAGALVVHLTYVPAVGNRSSNRKPLLFGRILDQMADWTADHRATQVVPEIGVDSADLVLVRHSGISPTHGTETFKILRNVGVTSLAGVSTNIAVPVVAVEATDEGFDVLVASDAVAGTPATHSESILEHTLAFVAATTTTDELLASWAKTDEPIPSRS